MSDASLTPECLAHLGIHRQPFAQDVTEEYIYTDAAVDMPVGVMLEHLRTRRLPLLLKGEPGIGKTTLLLALERRAGATLRFCHLRATPKLTLQTIVGEVRSHWARGERSPDVTEELHLHEHIGVHVEGQNHPVLVIDDGHRLSAQLLDGVLRLKHEVDQRAPLPLGLVIAARPEVALVLTELEATNAEAGRMVTVNVRPLNRKQTVAFIHHRLAAAGAAGKLHITDATANSIQRMSGGIPGRINLAAAHLIEELSRRQQRPADGRRLSALVWSVLGVLAAAAAAAFVWVNRSSFL